MDGAQSLIAILVVAAVVSAGWCLKIYLAAKSRDLKAALNARAQDRELERFRIFSDLVGKMTPGMD